ncbi:MAG: PEP-CTERM sorting domain-containing protein [bacterium]|nr:PEP-CTERM sorting domain-containing protein [bacterium]
MLKRIRKFLVIGLISGLIVIKAGVSSGLPMVEIEYNITELSDIWTYSYTLKNTGSEAIWLWDIYPTVVVSDITKPSIDWDILTDYNSWIEWYSPFTEILPCSSLAGFSYKSSGTPGWIKYEVESTLGGIISGYTRGATPEPSAFILLGSGILVGVRLWRKRNFGG